MDKVEPEFGDATCMDCGKESNIFEYINDPVEMWVWCESCKIDTFHNPINAGKEYEE